MIIKSISYFYSGEMDKINRVNNFHTKFILYSSYEVFRIINLLVKLKEILQGSNERFTIFKKY